MTELGLDALAKYGPRFRDVGSDERLSVVFTVRPAPEEGPSAAEDGGITAKKKADERIAERDLHAKQGKAAVAIQAYQAAIEGLTRPLPFSSDTPHDQVRTAVEEATKIRAKYLRALENEEWVVLPGPTYVKTFLRTYAQFLGLDPRLLVDEYSARFEEPEHLEVAAFTPRRRIPETARRVGPPRRGIGAAVVVLAFIGFLLILGLTGEEDKGSKAGRRDGRRSGASAGSVDFTTCPR